jgi:hypothetical protein
VEDRVSDGRKLIEFLSRGQARTVSFLDACDWYVKFIDSKCTAHWRAIQPVVAVKHDVYEDAIAKVDTVLATIAISLSEKHNLALASIVDDLVNNNLITDDDMDERAASHQLIFTFLGWLSRFYKPLYVLILTSSQPIYMILDLIASPRSSKSPNSQ